MFSTTWNRGSETQLQVVENLNKGLNILFYLTLNFWPDPSGILDIYQNKFQPQDITDTQITLIYSKPYNNSCSLQGFEMWRHLAM